LRKKRSTKAAPAKRRKIIVEPLEPRTLFSADVVSASLALDLIEDNSIEQHNWLADAGQSQLTVSDDKGTAYPVQNKEVHNQPDSVLSDNKTGNSRSDIIGFEEQASEVIADLRTDLEQSRQLIVIDERVDDHEVLLQDVIDNGQSGTDFEIIRLVEGSDGVDVITSALIAAGDQKYDAVHIIAHGADAELQLGSTQLGTGNLQQYKTELSSWRFGLALDADILLYGCDVAQTEHGQQFVDQISQWTGADIASSDDTTGHVDLGGDWEFEYKVGEIDTDIVFSRTIQSTFSGTFASLPGEDAFWISTRLNVTDSNAPGLSDWDDQDVIQIDSLTLEDGDGSAGITDGTFSEAIDFNSITGTSADNDALHVVGAPITVQGVALLEGDLLFSGNKNQPYNSTNSISPNPHNVYVYRPDVAGDYSSGTFQLLINRTALGLVNAINGFSLVETDTTVGDQALSRGDFLYTSSTTDIHWFDSSTNTSNILIHGADIGNDEEFRGVELIESNTQVGGVDFNSGDLLVVIDSFATIGDNNIPGRNQDVIRLEVNSTGVGTTSAIASIVFDGSDVGIDFPEKFDALALTTVTSVNEAPEFAGLDPIVDYTAGGGPIILDSDITVVDSELTASDNFDGAQLQILRQQCDCRNRNSRQWW